MSFQLVPVSRGGVMYHNFKTEGSAFFPTPNNIDVAATQAREIPESEGYEEVSIFFFNSLGAHKYLKGKRRAELSGYVGSDKSLNTLQTLVRECSVSKVAIFYDDDVAFYDIKKPVKAYNSLVESLTQKAD